MISSEVQRQTPRAIKITKVVLENKVPMNVWGIILAPATSLADARKRIKRIKDSAEKDDGNDDALVLAGQYEQVLELLEKNWRLIWPEVLIP